MLRFVVDFTLPVEIHLQSGGLTNTAFQLERLQINESWTVVDNDPADDGYGVFKIMPQQGQLHDSLRVLAVPFNITGAAASVDIFVQVIQGASAPPSPLFPPVPPLSPGGYKFMSATAGEMNLGLLKLIST